MKLSPFLILVLLATLSLWAGVHASQAAALEPIEIDDSASLQGTSTPAPPSASAAGTITPELTKAPRRTPIPIPTPPVSDPDTTQLLVTFGVIPGIIVLIGLGLNRKRIF